MGRAPDGIVTNISRIGSTRIDNANYAPQFSNGNTLGEDTPTAPGDGFSLFASHNNIMNENTARNNAFTGYRLIASDGNKIAGNTEDDNADGFSIEVGSTRNEVILNWIRSNDRGIHICKSVFKQNDMFPTTSAAHNRQSQSTRRARREELL